MLYCVIMQDLACVDDQGEIYNLYIAEKECARTYRSNRLNFRRRSWKRMPSFHPQRWLRIVKLMSTNLRKEKRREDGIHPKWLEDAVMISSFHNRTPQFPPIVTPTRAAKKKRRLKGE